MLHGLFIYAPAMNAVFGSSWLDPRDIALAAAAAAVIIPIIGIEKWIRSKH
jgi:Ca2+-transporting ATPase